MTLETLEMVKKLVKDCPDTISAVYSYRHAITGKTLYSIESWVNQGVTLRSGMVLCPQLIYDGYNMEWLNDNS